DTLVVPLRAREFSPSDRAGRKPAAIISPSAAKAWFGAEDPLGQRIAVRMFPDRSAQLEIVGVVGNIDRPWTAVKPQVYWPYPFEPTQPMDLVVRSAQRALHLESALQSAIRGV